MQLHTHCVLPSHTRCCERTVCLVDMFVFVLLFPVSCLRSLPLPFPRPPLLPLTPSHLTPFLALSLLFLSQFLSLQPLLLPTLSLFFSERVFLCVLCAWYMALYVISLCVVCMAHGAPPWHAAHDAHVHAPHVPVLHLFFLLRSQCKWLCGFMPAPGRECLSCSLSCLSMYFGACAYVCTCVGAYIVAGVCARGCPCGLCVCMWVSVLLVCVHVGGMVFCARVDILFRKWQELTSQCLFSLTFPALLLRSRFVFLCVCARVYAHTVVNAACLLCRQVVLAAIFGTCLDPFVSRACIGRQHLQDMLALARERERQHIVTLLTFDVCSMPLSTCRVYLSCLFVCVYLPVCLPVRVYVCVWLEAGSSKRWV